jgi:murein DD-endopeptidase MepM/ murein hydrolase activator NlpD
MAKKHYSFIIVPHHKGESKKISLPEKRVKILVGVLSLILILFTLFLVDYFTMIAGLKSPEVQRELGVGGGGRGDEQALNPQAVPQDLGLRKAESIAQKAQGVDRSLNTLLEIFEDKEYQMATTPSIWPTNGYHSSNFGKRIDPFTRKEEFHYGIDVAASHGSPIYATADGYVLKIKTETTGGKLIILNHGSGVTTVYCHLSQFNVKIGQKVKRWDVIGFVGQSGKAIGPHVHYEVRKNGRAVNPMNYIVEW